MIPSQKRSRSVVRLLAVLPALMLVGTAAWVESLNNEHHLLTKRAEVERRLVEVRERLYGHVNSDIQLVRGLAALVSLKPDIDQADWERAVMPLFDGRSHVRNVAGAPDLVIRLMAPMAGNERAIGAAYRNLPAQFPSVEQARISRQVVVAGPVKLVQGGEGIIIRSPVYLTRPDGSETFWGLLSGVIDLDRLYRRVGLVDGALGIEVAIRGRDGGGPAGEVFFGRSSLFGELPVMVDLRLTQGSWRLAAMPIGGWPTQAPDTWLLRGGFVVAALLLLAMFALIERTLRASAVARDRAESTRRQIASVLEAAPDAMLVADRDGRIVRVNSAAQTLFGFEREAMLGRHTSQLLPPVGEPQAQPEGRRADGSFFPAEVRSSPLADDEEPRQVFAIRDISERLRGEQLASAKEAAEAANRAKSSFLANMSHEIRTPLNAIAGMVHLMRHAGVSPEQALRLDKVQAASAHLLQVINAILDLSKIEAERFELARSQVDLQRIAGDVAAMVQPRLQAKGVALVCEVPEAVPPLLGDPTRLQQALLNYAANAALFTEEGSVTMRVVVSAPVDGLVPVLFEVLDTGPGIPASTLERLFTPFEQADNSSTRAHGGTGLGLAISRRLARLMGGDAGAESVPGQGSRFWFSARLELGSLADAAPPVAPRNSLQHRIAGGLIGRRLLLVEDDAVNQLVAGEVLAIAGASVEVAGDGEQAVAMAAEGDYDLILMDLQMPRLNGLDATRRIRTQARHASTPIIAMTANAFEEDRRACLAAGMDDFIAKPFDPEELHRVLARWLGAAGAPPVPAPAPMRPDVAGEVGAD